MICVHLTLQLQPYLNACSPPQQLNTPMSSAQSLSVTPAIPSGRGIYRKEQARRGEFTQKPSQGITLWVERFRAMVKEFQAHFANASGPVPALPTSHARWTDMGNSGKCLYVWLIMACDQKLVDLEWAFASGAIDRDSGFLGIKAVSVIDKAAFDKAHFPTPSGFVAGGGFFDQKKTLVKHWHTAGFAEWEGRMVFSSELRRRLHTQSSRASRKDGSAVGGATYAVVAQQSAVPPAVSSQDFEAVQALLMLPNISVTSPVVSVMP